MTLLKTYKRHTPADEMLDGRRIAWLVSNEARQVVFSTYGRDGKKYTQTIRKGDGATHCTCEHERWRRIEEDRCWHSKGALVSLMRRVNRGEISKPAFFNR